MFKVRRWWLLCGVVLVGVVALNGVVDGVVDAKAAPAPRAVCVRGGATAIDGVSGRGLVCVRTKVRGLRWRFQPAVVTTTTTSTTPTTTTTTTVSGVVAPVLVSVSASDDVQITVAGMRPDTGVYSLQWVPYGQTFNTYQMARATSASMSVPAGWFACNRTYTFRVFVMQAGWQLADGHQTQNVTPHSTPFDVVMPACPTPATPLTCATAYCVGDTGPGGGIVFYVHATGTFTCGVALTSTCKYLEAAPTSGTAAWTDAFYVWSGNTANEIGAAAEGVAIGTGFKNTQAMVTQTGGGDTAGMAGTVTRAYRGPNSLTDWYLPSKDELNQMCKWQSGQAWVSDATICNNTGILNSGTGASGFLNGPYWSSSEADGAIDGWGQHFDTGSQGGLTKANANYVYVRPVRAFGGTVACADGGVCAVGDTGPGGGIVFYVQATGTFPCGATLASTCRYLEAAPTSGTSAWTDATYVWSGNTTELIGATAQGVAIGIGRKNTEAMVTQNDTAGRAGTFTRAYRGPNNLTDWYLPSKDELNQMCKWQRGVDWTSDATVCTGGTLNSGTGASGFSTGRYWSSSEADAGTAWLQFFDEEPRGYQGTGTKSLTTYFVRPVRAFG